MCWNLSLKSKPPSPDYTKLLVLDHIRLYANNQQSLSTTGSSSRQTPVSLLTDEERKCRQGWHNPNANHPKPNCWFLYPHLRPSYEDKKTEASVSRFHSSLSKINATFILDSGSSSHMVSDMDLFISLDSTEEGCVKTSSGNDSLSIKGIGTIKLSNEFGDLFFSHVLYVPQLVVNLLSVQCLVLDQFDVQFKKHSFSITQDNITVMRGRYKGYLPCLNFKNIKERPFLSASEELHKSLGH
ncbi:hypothetical protein VP01_7397g1, partial [Puccinia sorghi]